MSLPWTVVPTEALEGRGLAPYSPDEIGNLFDWAENPDASSAHLMPFTGDILVDVVAIDDNAVHQHCKPDDEIVFVQSGRLHLTNDADGAQLSVPAGRCVFIPKGWFGMYRVEATETSFVELALVPRDYFGSDAGNRPDEKALPVSIDAANSHPHQEWMLGKFVIESHVLEPGRGLIGNTSHDTIVQIRRGHVRLEASGHEVNFAPGSFFVIPKGLSAHALAVTPCEIITARLG